MTLALALKGKDFVVAGSDSRGTFGDFRVATATIDVMKKCAIVSPHVAILVAGAAEIGDYLVAEYQAGEEVKRDGVTNIATTFASFVQQRWNQWFGNVPFENRPAVLFIVAGLDEVKGVYKEPRIYSLFSQFGFAPGIHRYGFACIGVPIFATYLLNKHYKPDLPLEDLSGLVAYAISETASQDQRVGGPIALIHITEEGARELSLEDAQRILEDYRQKIER